MFSTAVRSRNRTGRSLEDAAGLRTVLTGMQLHAGLRYLCPASLPKDPIVRIGIDVLTQVGSGVFRASVLTSGSISEGDGVSLAPAISLPLQVTSS